MRPLRGGGPQVQLLAGLAAWHENARLVAVLDARADLVDLVIEQQSLVQHLAQTDVGADALTHTRDALERAMSRGGSAHVHAAEVARRILDHREGLQRAWPDDGLRIRRVQGALDAWQTAESCRFLCGQADFRSARTSDGGPRAR